MDALVLGARKLVIKHTSGSQGVTSEGEIKALLRRERVAFAAKVRAARAALGWTQRELGSRVPLTQSSVYKMEQGTHDLRRSTVVRVEQRLESRKASNLKTCPVAASRSWFAKASFPSCWIDLLPVETY